jgi:UBX domain
MSRDLEEQRKQEVKREEERSKEEWEALIMNKRERLGEEPAEGIEGIVMVVFRKPTGNERIQRRFKKDDLIERLYDFIDLELSQDNKVGFEIAQG